MHTRLRGENRENPARFPLELLNGLIQISLDQVD